MKTLGDECNSKISMLGRELESQKCLEIVGD